MTNTISPREELEKLLPEYKSLTQKVTEGTNSPDDLKRLDEIGEATTSLMERVAAAKSHGGRVNVADAFLAELGRPDAFATTAPGEVDGKSGMANPNGMTLGEAFTKSPAFTEFVGRFKDASGGIVDNTTVGRHGMPMGKGLYRTKTLVTGLSDTSAGAFVTSARLPVVSDLVGERRLYVRDLCTNISIPGKDTFEFVTVTGKTNNAATVLEATTSATPGLNNVAVGAYTAAHGVKPESAVAFAVVSAIVETIAHTIPVSRRAAADGGQVMQYINDFLMYGLREEEEDQILNGNGTTPNLRGILQTVGINTVGSAGTDLDAVVAGIAAIREDNREPTAMVIHPNDWFSTGFLLAKDTAGNYLVGDPRASIDQMNSLWGLRVVVTPAMTENTVLIGDFSQYVVADSERGTLYVTDSHNDHFVRNILDILAEERLAGGCLDPEAFCTVTAV
jgi:HK97 family phage major capsid protein